MEEIGITQASTSQEVGYTVLIHYQDRSAIIRRQRHHRVSGWTDDESYCVSSVSNDTDYSLLPAS